jgi:hypothetical protein
MYNLTNMKISINCSSTESSQSNLIRIYKNVINSVGDVEVNNGILNSNDMSFKPVR